MERSKLIGKVYRLYVSEGPVAALSLIDRVLGEHPDLHPSDTKMLSHWKRLWNQAADPDYQPASYPRYQEYDALWERAKHNFAKKEYRSALPDAWLYLQYCAVGTIAFQDALGLVIDCAVLAGEEEAAERLAQLWLSHRHLLSLAESGLVPESAIKFTVFEPYILERGDSLSGIDREKPITSLDMSSLKVPLRGAMEAMKNNASDIWAHVLVAALETNMISSTARQEIFLILISYYSENGDTVALEKLVGD